MAAALAAAGLEAVYSLAGRTNTPARAALPTRIGGFGGVAGLAEWLAENRITHVIDATHPFAAQMSRNAIDACAATDLPLVALQRPEWQPEPGDRWTRLPDIAAAVAHLPETPARVFLAIGRQTLAPFAARPEHHYLLRLVDPPEGPLPLPQAEVVVDRGPFTVAGDTALLQRFRADLIVAKNAGGRGASAKIAAARGLGLPILMIDRPALPDRPTVATPAEALDWLHGTDRGV